MISRRTFLVSASLLVAGAGCRNGSSSSVETFSSGYLGSPDQTMENHLLIAARAGELPSAAVSTFQSRSHVSVTSEDPGADGSLLLRLAAGGYGEVDIALVGDVAAGTGLVADEQVEDMVAVPDQLCADADFLLTVKGESMINAGILPGDFVVVRKQDDARNGEIVVALVGDEDATVKRFFRESGRVRLQPENDEMEPMYPEQVRILGTVRAVLRRL